MNNTQLQLHCYMPNFLTTVPHHTFYTNKLNLIFIYCFHNLGTKHFLLICNVKAEDSGEIKFVAKQAESTAYLEVEGIHHPISLLSCDITHS